MTQFLCIHLIGEQNSPSAPLEQQHSQFSIQVVEASAYGKRHRRGKPGSPEVVAICDHFIALSAAEAEYKIDGKVLGFAHGDNKCRRFSLICDGTLLLPIPSE